VVERHSSEEVGDHTCWKEEVLVVDNPSLAEVFGSLLHKEVYSAEMVVGRRIPHHQNSVAAVRM
jgi:hypothetical protein